MPLTKEDRINTVFNGGKHVVILGAGASIASSIRNPEKTGKRLPSMDNFIEVVGLEDIVGRLPERLKAKNFEKLYSNLHKDDPASVEIKEIETRVRKYFGEMELPDVPTIYDYLVLSLRPKDLIATFNWDPFLFQAWLRNKPYAMPPNLAFLHGNVAIGYNAIMKRSGPSNYYHAESGSTFVPTKLLYPVDQKNYSIDEFISLEWDRVKRWLTDERTMRFTIFGYGAPATDIEAVRLLNEAWGTSADRPKEQFEIIDIRPEEEVRKQWDTFIHSHHYNYSTSYFKSSLAYNPRRTFESYHQHMFPFTPDEAFSESNPVPSDFKTLDELREWHRPLVEAET